MPPRHIGFLRACATPLSLVLFWYSVFAEGEPSQIHLRNETILTSPGLNQSGAAALVARPDPTSGLFLIQFTGPLEPVWRTRLRSEGVRLLKYVPDNAYIAKFENVSVPGVSSLNFVRWVGAYRPELKIHARLAAAAKAAAVTNQNVRVSILLSSQATPAELTSVRLLLASISTESHLRQGTILRGELAPARLDVLAQSPAVLWVERAPVRKLVDEAASKLVAGDDGQVKTPTLTQQMGFDGRGVTVCVADTGLDTGDTNTMHPDVKGRVTGFLPYGSIADGSDGYGHGTHAAGIVAGNGATGETDPDTGALYGLGVASGADLFIERIFDDTASEANPFPSDETLTRDAIRRGAHIGSNSWGNDVQGEYDTDASQFDELVRDADSVTPGDQPYILVFSAGNAGPGSETLDSPASAKNVIAVGACENVPGTLALTYGLYADDADTMADFSSRGPCEDGRVKPDVVAPGTWIASMASSSAPDEAAIAWTAIDQYYVYMGGTSMSGPHAAGAAACFVQFYRTFHTNATPSPALVKAALINSATELDQSNGGPGFIPNNDEGWGRVTLTNIIQTNFATTSRSFEYVDQTDLLTNGELYVHHSLIKSSDEPLKITLAYTDLPGFPGAIPALVNDLDLEVIAPDGTLYRGNQFVGGESLPNAAAADSLNNVEAVHLVSPVPGDYQIRVRARKIVEDARFDTAVIDQDFALVISGDIARPGTGTVLLDRTNYTAPGSIRLQVLDPTRAAAGSVTVRLKSTTEPAGESYTLTSSGASGSFTGTVATVRGAAAVDGKLEIQNGDTIEADYTDASSQVRIASAMADLVPPALTSVASSIDLGVITITWQTTEPADSMVRYGTNATLNLVASDPTLTTVHSIKLRNLVAGRTYYFLVSSSDPAGNSATNNNSGSLYSFVAVASPIVLLVDAYENADGSPEISDGAYTNALAAAGYSFGFWKVTQRGSPLLTDLQPFPVVIWRTTDDIVNYDGTNNTLTAQQQFMIQTYLNGGGSFFMASMGILSRLGDVAFRRDVLQVAGFIQNPDPPSPCSSCDEYFGVPAVLGASASPISVGMSTLLDYSSYPSFDLGLGGPNDVYGPDFSDTFTPSTNSTPVLFESVTGKPCGMSYPRVGVDSPGRVVFLSFPLDAVPANGVSPNDEVTLLRNALRFLAPGANGVGTIALDNSTFTVPDRVTVEVGDSDLAGLGQAQVTFASSSGGSPVVITLNETPHPGLFRGFISLVGTNATGTQLSVRNGDTITAQYFDASSQSNAVAVATIDTVPPVITKVASTTGFSDAVVTWTSSKPADALVQYGGAALLDRTAYSAPITTNHSVLVSGLAANRTYFYQVVSRDDAGNTTVDDNHGALYSFRTLKAPQPPWFDDLESGARQWSVVADPTTGSDMNWTLGTPNNGLQTTAHSGTNAWGSDLHGEQFNLLASSYLLSPNIDLSGLSTATLTFWDCYDFSSGLEQGQMLVSTNSGASFTALPVLADFSGSSALDWTEETLDLTPFVGQTVQIVWDYAGVSIGSALFGWLVDDVSITGVFAGAGGNIVIMKNISQGTYTLSGPISQSGTALSATIAGAPPGQYSLRFSDVPFYQTPPALTNLLASLSSITFSGSYTFEDTNHNGISDAWEQFYFGAVPPTDSAAKDSDGDGMSDAAEFIAGTNPTNAASRFIFLSNIETNQVLKLQWSAVPGRMYQVQSSTNLDSWVPASDWIQAVASPMSYSATNLTSGSRLYRVQVRP